MSKTRKDFSTRRHEPREDSAKQKLHSSRVARTQAHVLLHQLAAEATSAVDLDDLEEFDEFPQFEKM